MAGIAEFWYVVKINFLKITMMRLKCVFFRFWIPLNAIEKKCPDWEIQKIHIICQLGREKGCWKIFKLNGDLIFLWQHKKFWRSFIFLKNPLKFALYDFKNWKTATLELQGLSYHKLIDLMTCSISIFIADFDQDEKFENF